MSADMITEAAERMQELPESQQRHVLEIVRALQQTAPEGEPGSNLLQFAGLFPPEDCDEIEKAIEEGCESINPDNDLWIAALARQYSLTLASRDAHFRDVDGLNVEEW
jgi:predicted nucleic acid-binding protein